VLRSPVILSPVLRGEESRWAIRGKHLVSRFFAAEIAAQNDDMFACLPKTVASLTEVRAQGWGV